MNPDISKAADIYYNQRDLFWEQMIDETYDELNAVLEDRDLSFFYVMLQGLNELDESYL